MQYYEKFEYEFSKIYKRLLRLELLLKWKMIDCVTLVYRNNAISAFSKFFSNEKIINKYFNDKGANTFMSILNDESLPESARFINIIPILHLRHILMFIFHEEAFRVPSIQNRFYDKIPQTFSELRKKSKDLINLRNDIAHFNFKRYRENKINYHEALILFEMHIGCSLGKYSHIPNDLTFKPSIMQIHKKIYELAPELYKKETPHQNFAYNKDRMIIDMFEDIAVLNGWEYCDLKSPWDIIREKYNFIKKLKELNPQEEFDTDNGQISIFDSLENNPTS